MTHAALMVTGSDAMSSQVLNAASFDLWGSRLIEASAGTGKTWTIAALYLRLVLGHGGANGFERPLRPSEILVMTFTRAATRELSDRIRDRLLNAAQCFRGEKAIDTDDMFLLGLMSAYASGPERNRAAHALAMAAENMDDASIHTIDAWCQRMLKEHAFDSKNLFDETLVADEQAMLMEASQDYWRQACYPLDSEHLSQVLGLWRSVDALIKDMQNLHDQDIAPQAGDGTLQEVLDRATAERATTLRQIKMGWADRAQRMQDWLNGQLPAAAHGWKTLRKADFERWLGALKTWADGESETSLIEVIGETGCERLTPDGLTQVRAIGSSAIDFPGEFAEFAQLQIALAKLPEIAVQVRLHAAAQVAKRLLQLKRNTSSFGFADMLHRLNAALRGEKGQSLRNRILAQYPVILIDEFQDTSPLQYQIFDQIYRTQSNDLHSGLFLIGDPKQSIYGFRGADIHSYLQARRATAGRHYMLETNYRSTRALVDVINTWFGHADTQRSEGTFMYRTPDDNPLPFVKVSAHGRQEHFVCDTGTVPAMTLIHDLEVKNFREMRQCFAARCAEQVVTWLNDPKAGFAKADGFKPLKPADIAILVRTGQEAAAVQRELARRSIASVYLSDKESVLNSTEASDLVHWLRAVAMPQDVKLVRAGLATRILGLSLDELMWLAGNDEAFDARCEQLRHLRSTWQRQGVLAMLRQTLHLFGLSAKFLEQTGGERSLTNVLHLAELLQNASTTLDGDQALIRWLQAEISQENTQSDEQIVRLESDADLVKVITIHKSKGLEYPLVCLPYATSFREKDSQTTTYVNLADEHGHRELRLQFSKEELAQADRDRLREDVRLLYVAMTRARHALWVGFSAIKVGRSVQCVSHKSGAGYVLGGPDQINAEDWLNPLEQCAAMNEHIALQAAEHGTACTPLKRTDDSADLRESSIYKADFERDWSIASFSELTRNMSETTGTKLSHVNRPTDDEGNWDGIASDVPPKYAQAEGDAVTWHKFSRGPEAGNFLHDQLEWLAVERFALHDNDTLTTRLQRHCERSGREKDAELVTSWLTQVVQTILPGPEVALVELDNVLTEMEFWLPVHPMNAQWVDVQCRQHLLPGIDRPSLADRHLHGMLMGFVDLVFVHQGKYWLLDYKSNHLGDCDEDYCHHALYRAMAEHRYDVQATLYLLALHRLLKSRLGSSYQPEEHLGGAIYLFLRGVKGPQNGVCLIPACMPLLDAMDSMLVAKAML